MAEIGFMKQTEDAFQAVAAKVLKCPFQPLQPVDYEIVARFYALWHARAERRHLPQQSLKLNGVLSSEVRGVDELEQLEANGYMAVDGKGEVAFRHINATLIRFRMGKLFEQLAGVMWGQIAAVAGEFCVPDTPLHGIIPISPSLALIQNTQSGWITESNLKQLNQAIKAQAGDYIFARTLDAAPGAVEA